MYNDLYSGKTEAALPIVGNSSSAPPEDVSLTGQEPPSGLHVAIQPAPAAPEVVLNPASLKIERPPHLAVHSQPVQYQALSMDKGGHAPLGLVKKVSETQQVVTNTTGVIGQKRPREEEVGNGDGDDADVKLGAPPPSIIPQYDGAGEHDEGANEGKSGSDNDDDLLNEEDDLADADDHEEVDEDSIKNVILGQFDKVHRTKAKWRINLKNCVATVNGRDYLLKKITGEMNFA